MTYHYYYYLLLTTYYLLPTTTTYYLLPTTYCLLPTAYYLLPTTYYLLLTTYYLLPTTFYLLPTTYYLLFTTCYLPTYYLPLTAYYLSYLFRITTACLYISPLHLTLTPLHYIPLLLVTTTVHLSGDNHTGTREAHDINSGLSRVIYTELGGQIPVTSRDVQRTIMMVGPNFGQSMPEKPMRVEVLEGEMEVEDRGGGSSDAGDGGGDGEGSRTQKSAGLSPHRDSQGFFDGHQVPIAGLLHTLVAITDLQPDGDRSLRIYDPEVTAEREAFEKVQLPSVVLTRVPNDPKGPLRYSFEPRHDSIYILPGHPLSKSQCAVRSR